MTVKVKYSTISCKLLIAINITMSCTHNCSVCRLPQVFIKLEFTEYTVRENIGSENFALKVCAVAADMAFPVQVSFNTTNGTARSK